MKKSLLVFVLALALSAASAFATTATGNLSITVANPLTITTTSLPTAAPGVAYSHALAATGGIAPYTWSLTGTLPPGLTLSAAGLISGTVTPTDAGNTYSFSVTVTDSATNPMVVTAHGKITQ